MDYTSTSSFPSIEGSSYVILLLSVGVLKRSVIEMVVFNNLSPEAEKEMVATGVKLIQGSLSPEAYISKLESVVKKTVNKSIKFDDYVIQQLLGRLNLSRSANTVNQTLGKETEKKIKKDGTLKPMNEAGSIIEKEDPRFTSLPNWDKELIISPLASYKNFHEGDRVTKVKLDWAINFIKKTLPNTNPSYQRKVEHLFSSLDAIGGQQFKPEPVVQNFQLNSVSKNGNIIGEANEGLYNKGYKW